MPHRCTKCGNTIPDGSQELFDGCDECSNQSWEYIDTSRNSTERSDSTTGVEEDESQEKARTEFVTDEELPDKDISGLQNPKAGIDINEEAQPVRETDEIREKLNNQYEGIQVRRKGHYEINLTELYRGASYVIEIGDDGAYQVQRADE